MAQDPPSSIDVTDIQFKVHDKFTVFNPADHLRSSVNLLATASNYGLMFVGNPNEAELKVILIKDLVESKSSGRGLHARQVQLPNLPNCIAVSCDGSMLAVNYTQNGFGFVAIYSVPSFTTANIKSLHNIRLPGDENVSALQLLWNPVISGSLAVVMSNGALGMYDFKNNSYEFNTLDSKEQINCGSWSPKGKQIVLGFPNGKLAQYKPDLKLARTIPCPPNIHPGPFYTIAIQWLSTFQFAVVFLQQGNEATPCLFIVHAPKAGSPTFTTYYDICYSYTGPRTQQVNLVHIQAWNLLLVTSANGVEVGILGTKETTEAPSWVQYTLLDEARIEMPLTEEKDESYPIGFALDTSSVHQLTIAERTIPVMPMIHVLSTHGQLVAFNFLNLQPNTPDICSPPPPFSDTSGMSQFKPVSEMLNQRKPEITIPATTVPLTVVSQSAPFELSFAPLGSTSTPALEKPKAIFGTGVPQATANIFGGSTTGFSFGAPAVGAVSSGTPSLFKNQAPAKTQPSSFGFGEAQRQQDQVTVSTNLLPNPEKSKPLYTVPPNFTPPTAVVSSQTATNQGSRELGQLSSINANEVNDIVNEMILLQISSFDLELKKLGNQSKGLLNNIGSTDEVKGYSKRLNDLQEIVDQANGREFESDLQSLRNLLNESYAMVAECRSKLNMYQNPEISKLTSASSSNPINRRQLAKLKSYLANNQTQLKIIHNQIDAQWSSFQDLVKRNSRTQMHTPCLEGTYQRMTKLKDMIARERTKINYVKSKLKEKGLLFNQHQNTQNPELTMESLTDTILSMSLAPTVEENRSRLSNEKLTAIRDVIRNRKVVIIKPQRPDCVGLNSEVILETKLKSDRKIRDGAATNMDKMEQERIKSEQQRVLTKPTATKAVASSMASISQPNAPTNFGFGGTSPFVKPNPAKSDDYKKDQQPQQPPQQPAIVKPVASTPSFSVFRPTPSPNATFSNFSITPTTIPTFTGFGTNSSLTFGAPKSFNINQQPEKDLFSTENTQKEQSGPVSFAPKPMAPEAKPFAPTNFSSPFAAVAPTKPAETIDKENKAPDSQPFIPVGSRPDSSASTPNSTSSIAFAPSSVSSGFSFLGTNAATSIQSNNTADVSTPFTFSFNSALNSGTDTTSIASKPLLSSFTKPSPSLSKVDAAPEISVSVTQTKPNNTAAESNQDTTGFTFSSLNLGTLGLPATPSLSPTPSVSIADSACPASAATAKTTNASTSDPTDSIFGGLTICKPNTADNDGAFKPTFKGGNLFGSGSFSSDAEPKSVFKGTDKEQISFTGFGNTADSTKSAFGIGLTPSSTGSAATTSVTSVFGAKSTQPLTFGTPSVLTTPSSIATGQVSSSTSQSLSSSFSTPPSSGTTIFAVTATSTTATAPTSSAGAPILGGTTLAFGAPTSQSNVSMLGGQTVSSVANTPGILSPFTSVTPVATSTGTPVPSFEAATTTSSSSLFGSAAPPPNQTFFAKTDGNLFGTSSSDQSASGGSIFGGQASAFSGQGTNTGSSIFGGGSSAGTGQFGSSTFPSTGGNIFGSPAPSSAQNVFSTPPQSTAASGGSIFDQSSATGQSGGPIFGGAATQSGFGSPNNLFGSNATSGGSVFGGSATSTTPKPSVFESSNSAPLAFGSGESSGFGLFSQTPAFGSPTQAGTGSFGQGGSSITQTGFGAPSTGASFGNPVFGGTPAFGAAPAFGSPPSFGSAATFGSPKGFGSFAAPASTGGAFTSPTQKNNLFEALGSSDTGLSFGNLAQNTNANQQKPAFGGSSFMSYRS